MPSIELAGRLRSAFGEVPYNQNISFLQQLYYLVKGAEEGYTSDGSFEDITIRKEGGESISFSTVMKPSSDIAQGVFAPPPIISFSKGKNLIETPIDGDDAVVVERFGDKQWTLKIQGLLIDMVNHQYPSDKIVTLNEFFHLRQSVIVEGRQFDDKGIQNIYFTNAEIAGLQGFEDTVQYSLEAKSIKPIEFFLSKK